MNNSFEISHDVKTAIARNAPVVALESTVIAHGLPTEAAIDAAKQMQSEIDSEGCVAAVIGIIGGKIKIGLSDEEIEHIATAENVLKVSTREIAYAIANKLDGATTVAATAFLSYNAGIPVMATGGIGGVHRGAGESFDISADLWELVKTPSMVVCSGAKSILDLPATLEWLETYHVAVYGYKTDEFPAFYSSKSGLKVSKLNTPEEVSDLYQTRIGVGQRSGMIVGVPVPENDAEELSELINMAVQDAKDDGITGAALTPWILARVQELSGGAAISANVSLLKNNAKVAAQIAAEMMDKKDKRIGFTMR